MVGVICGGLTTVTDTAELRADLHKGSRPPGRPASTPEQLESAGLRRIADLGIAILRCLRARGGSYPSEKALRAWLSADGVSYSSNDVGPALSLAASVGLLSRPETGLGQPRPGWLPTGSEAPTVPPRVRTWCGR